MKDFSASCIDCGYPLDGIASSACPECGRAFDRDDPMSFQRVLGDPVRLLRAPLVEALAARWELESADIPAAVHDEVGGVIGYAPVLEGSLWVNQADATRAQEILSTIANRPPVRDTWICPRCGETNEPQFDACWKCQADRDPN